MFQGCFGCCLDLVVDALPVAVHRYHDWEPFNPDDPQSFWDAKLFQLVDPDILPTDKSGGFPTRDLRG
jgi:hypothetical protein